MNITERISALSKEYAELEKVKQDAHDRMKVIKSTMGKLQTIAKHAEDLFAEEQVKESVN